MNKEKVEYPVRINRYLFLTGQCSRREADRLIEKGQVLVNGKKAVLGQKIAENDDVSISFRAQKKLEKRDYIVFNKPKGVVSINPTEGEKDFRSFGKFPSNIAPVGRLDKDSYGLLFLTNDGRIVNKMLNPKYDHEKEYVVRVDKDLKPSFKKKMEQGVDIEGYITKPTKVKILGDKKFRIILTEGKKHQIRRMCMALGYAVRDLKRTRIMHIKLGNLKPGQLRKLKKEESKKLLELI